MQKTRTVAAMDCFPLSAVSGEGEVRVGGAPTPAHSTDRDFTMDRVELRSCLWSTIIHA